MTGGGEKVPLWEFVGVGVCVPGRVCVFSESVFLSAAGVPATLKVLRLVSKTMPCRENKLCISTC